MNNLTVKTANYPYSVGWAITNICNLHCIHCNMDSGIGLKNELNTEECFKIIDELRDNNVQKICFFGGEPFARKDFLKIVDYSFNKGFFINVTTNSLLITEEMIKKDLYKFDLIRVSLDGPTPDTHEFIRNKKGLFNKTIENIKKLVANGIDVGVVTCISHKNIDYLEQMVELLKELKIKRWFLPLLSSAGRGSAISKEVLTPLEVKEFLVKINDLTKDAPFIVNLDLPYNVLLKERNPNVKSACPAAITEMAIFANGDVSPCCEIPVIGGNLREDTVKNIWNSSKVFKEFRNKSLIRGKCGKCEYLINCGGCRANAFIKYNDYLEGDDICWH